MRKEGKKECNMQAKQLAFFIIAFSLAGGVINSTGIFNSVDVYAVDDIDSDMTDGIMEIDESASSEGDLATAIDGWKMIAQTFAVLKTVLSVLVLPGQYLVNLGVNVAFAGAIQIIFNLACAWGILQFVLNRSTAGLD
ncbi:MAG: hypothetical protein M0R51_08260 [Clostridia bacterium]|jgi:hypothetical protein|nr:hypothetical protein [Clostridia bacterium]